MMKKIFLLAMSLLSLSSFAQNNNPIHYPKTPVYLNPTPSFKDRSIQSTDPGAIEVRYPKKPIAQNIAFIINGQLIPYLDPWLADPTRISSFNLNKKDTIIDGHTYNGCVMIRTKSEYAPDYITLNDLKRKHTSIESGFSIFMIDDQIISDNAEKMMLDEKRVVCITVETVNDTRGNLAVNVIRIVTKSGTGINQSPDFWVRGNTNIKPAANYFDNNSGTEQQKMITNKRRSL